MLAWDYLYVYASMSFLLAFSSGANDSDVLAIAYGSKLFSVRQIIWFGALLEAIGAYFGGSAVSQTIAHEVVPGLEQLDNELVLKIMFVVTVSATNFRFAPSLSLSFRVSLECPLQPHTPWYVA